MPEWLDYNVLMHSTHIEGKSITAERFLKTFQSKIFKNLFFLI